MRIDERWYVRPEGVKERHSAGGVVVRRDGERWLVALAREGDFPEPVLPKGGIEVGETPLEAARREIAEELGISELEHVADLGTLGRLSFNKKRWITTHIFLFRTTQIEGRPTDPKHPHPATWRPLDNPPANMLWPDQRAILVERHDEITRLLGDA